MSAAALPRNFQFVPSVVYSLRKPVSLDALSSQASVADDDEVAVALSAVGARGTVATTAVCVLAPALVLGSEAPPALVARTR